MYIYIYIYMCVFLMELARTSPSRLFIHGKTCHVCSGLLAEGQAFTARDQLTVSGLGRFPNVWDLLAH